MCIALVSTPDAPVRRALRPVAARPCTHTHTHAHRQRSPRRLSCRPSPSRCTSARAAHITDMHSATHVTDKHSATHSAPHPRQCDARTRQCDACTRHYPSIAPQPSLRHEKQFTSKAARAPRPRARQPRARARRVPPSPRRTASSTPRQAPCRPRRRTCPPSRSRSCACGRGAAAARIGTGPPRRDARARAAAPKLQMMMRNAWHISGGEGWASNTSCRRVLVMHSDASQVSRTRTWRVVLISAVRAQEVVEILDDLGFRTTDIPAIKARLRQQGVKDIHSVKLTE